MTDVVYVDNEDMDMNQYDPIASVPSDHAYDTEAKQKNINDILKTFIPCVLETLGAYNSLSGKDLQAMFEMEWTDEMAIAYITQI